MKYIISILLFCFGLTVSAQNISVSDFHLDEMDQTANLQGTTVLDQNGEKCALIKVNTTQTGFNFDAGSLGVTKTIQKTAQIWVYVPHGVRKLSISHQKFGRLEYQLPVTTQKARTYIMDLKAETPLPVNSQRLTIKCQPKNAVVMIDNEPVDIQNGVGELTLELGSHDYIAWASGYYKTEGAIKLNADRPGRLVIELEAKEESTKADNQKEASLLPIKSNKPIINYDGPHEYVDLGLPSGILWATCNLGATNAEDIGAFYSWGDTEGSVIDSTNYYHFVGKYVSYSTVSKYCTKSKSGVVDNKMTLEPSDDAATVNWGEEWRMPTCEEFKELKKKCKTEWTTVNGVIGYLCTSKKNGNSIFFPVGKKGTFVKESEMSRFYWSSTLYTGIFGNEFAKGLKIEKSTFTTWDELRGTKYSIRPVRK